MLWIATASRSSLLRCQVVLKPSEYPGGHPWWRWGISLSRMERKSPPVRKPAAGGSHPAKPPETESSIAGARRDQKLAASIIPAAK